MREALEFSALLRQPRTTPEDEKIRYVDTIIDLLEMHDIENTLIGTPGAGLSVEQRKRLTIGVELVSKPSILIFLDEPTSGLDGQAAFNIVRFLRKLADVGQAVLVTASNPLFSFPFRILGSRDRGCRFTWRLLVLDFPLYERFRRIPESKCRLFETTSHNILYCTNWFRTISNSSR